MISPGVTFPQHSFTMPENSIYTFTRLKRALILIWGLFIIVCAASYVVFREELTPTNISSFIRDYQGGMLFLYFILCTIRGITMIPGTPFLLAGIIVFSYSPFLLLAVFLSSMLCTSALMYSLAGKLGFGSYFEEKYPEKILLVRDKLKGRNGFLFIFLWAFAPFTPTDLVCYVTASLRMRFIALIVPLLLGEAVICAFYIFNGQLLLQQWSPAI